MPLAEAATNAEAQIRGTMLFDAQWYLKNNPDVRQAAIDPLMHYIGYGAKEGRSPNPFFDGKWYAQQYLGGDTEVNPLIHYIDIGAGNGYSVSNPVSNELIQAYRQLLQPQSTPLETLILAYSLLEQSSLFESEWYLNEYPDVDAAGIDPLTHYIIYGCKENRSPNRFFVPSWYYQKSPGAEDYYNPLLHYLLKGAKLGYSTCETLHFFDLPGKHNKPHDETYTPLGAFLRSWYLVESTHLFERDWYLQQYKNVAAANVDPLYHYLIYGVGEGLDPNRLFNTRWYLSQYAQVAEAGDNPLAHYIERGAALGYAPHPFFIGPDGSSNELVIDSRQVTPLEYFLNVTVLKNPELFPNFSAYDVERATLDNIIRRERQAYLCHIGIMIDKPRFMIYVEGNNEEEISATQASLKLQAYDNFHLLPCDALPANGFVDLRRDDYVIWVYAGDSFYEHALYTLAAAINADPLLDLIYFDHDFNASGGHLQAIHKPQWSPDYLEAHNYIGRAFCIRATRFLEVSDGVVCHYDMLLKATEQDLRIQHLDEVLVRLVAGEPNQDLIDKERAALENRLRRTGRVGCVEPNARASGHYFIRAELKSNPLVSIIIPTAGKIIDYRGSRVDLIAQCVTSIFERSTYRNLEFVIIDNGDFDRARLQNAASAAMTYVTYLEPQFNMANKMNLGVSHARGEIIITLNDDIAVIAHDWIECMLGHFEKPHVGIVGARLLYPNNTIQHIGTIMCDGHLHHVMAGCPAADKGYENAAVTVRNCLGVTGALTMITKKLYQELGGYPAELPIDYNDSDLCFKVSKAGRSVVYEPRAELYHYHAVSVERPHRPQDFAYFSKKWALVSSDPFYNQHVFERYHPFNYNPRYSERSI